MRLDSLRPSEHAKIKKIYGTGTLRHHLLDMGLTPEVTVKLVKVAPMGDPVEIRVRGYHLTLRLDEAKMIEIEKISEENFKDDKDSKFEDKYITERKQDTAHPGVGEISRVSLNKKKKGLAIAKGAPVSFALVGNQNCGKTTLFNQLTGSNQHVGNFPGVTVDKKDGTIRQHPEATVTDLPGVYSLSPYSNEEIVTRDFLMDYKPTGIINIVDATNIERNLYLTMQLMELGIPMVLAVNMMDEVRSNGGTVHINDLESKLGIPVVPISAIKNEGIEELIDHALSVARYGNVPGRMDFCEDTGVAGDPISEVHRSIHAVEHLIDPFAQAQKLPVRFSATKMVEGDHLISEKLNLPEKENHILSEIITNMEQESGMDREAAMANMRFTFIDKLCRETVVKPQESKEYKRSVAIDKILTGKYTAIPAFILIMALVFVMTFSFIGAWLSDLMSIGVDSIIALVDRGLTDFGINPVVHSLVVDGICSGVGSVLSFLPVIVTLFFFLSILEDTGYMARVAFVMDKLIRKIGLSGRSIVPMLIGFGCSVPAIMATRTLSSERDRKMTILLTPFMSCSAKLPIYGLFATAFFPIHLRAVVMVGLYFFGIICGVLYAFILRKTVFKGEPVPFVMELPNYRLPSGKSILRLIWDKAKGFIQKAFTIIFLASIVIWFLQTFDIRFNVADTPDSSMLALLGGFIAPVFAPLGFGDWRVSTALITGFTAKESVVSTLTVLLGGDIDALGTLFSPFTAAVFLVFTLLYTPCVAAIATVRREMGGRGAALLTVVIQCGIAWIIAFLVHMAGTVMGLV